LFADGGAFAGAERVDAAHVREDAVTDVVDVVEIDRVALGDGGAIAPDPAGGDAGVVESAISL